MDAADRIARRLRLIQPRRLMGRFTAPRILVTSVPKAGTNMLRHTLYLFPQIRSETTVATRPLEEQLQRISETKRGQVISTHFPVSPALDQVLDQNHIQVANIIRDPRDVCVSLYHYIAKEPIFGVRRSYLRELPDDRSRLMAVINGIDVPRSDGVHVYWPSIAELFAMRLAWLDHPRACTVTFEELVGPDGGGSREYQRTAVRRLADHLSCRLTARDVDYITQRIFSRKSPTFRSGQIGSWKREMTQEHKQTFKELSGQLLVDLGYEVGFDW
jgi:hypothetical protein